jgi:hypothetical protein
LAIAVICIGPILWIIHNLSYYYHYYEDEKGPFVKLDNCIWYCYGAVLQQGACIRQVQFRRRDVDKPLQVER